MFRCLQFVKSVFIFGKHDRRYMLVACVVFLQRQFTFQAKYTYDSVSNRTGAKFGISGFRRCVDKAFALRDVGWCLFTDVSVCTNR
jgi:hypothetical protein